MGDQCSEVGPGRLVSYVPTAALVARATAVGGGFDDRLRVPGQPSSEALFSS